MVCFATAQAAIRVTSEDGGSRSQQYFENGNFVLVQDGQPAFGVDAAGNCWFVERDRLVFDSCEAMLDSMKGMRDQAMAGISAGDRAMMQQMMGMKSDGAVRVQAVGERTIAGYSSTCHTIGDAREVCVSKTLLDEIMNEMGNERFAQMMQRFQDSAASMGADDSQTKAVTRLFEEGYPMSDKQKAAAIPGMNPAMLKFLPEAQRAEIVRQMGAAGAGQQARGSQVTAVDKRVSMPNPDLSRYQRMSFGQYMQQMMGGIPGMQPPR